jgi:hypothetical protein
VRAHSIHAARRACAPSFAGAGAPAVEPAVTAANWGTELDYNALRARVGIQVPAPDLVGNHLLGGSMKPYRWTWDGRAFVAPKASFRTEPNAPDPPVTQIAVRKGQVVRLVLNNPTGMTHPFHIHGRHFQLLYQSPNNAGNYNNGALNLNAPCVKDTVSVHAGGHAVIQWKESNPGFWFFHCHIEWHLATGMAVVIHSTRPAADFADGSAQGPSSVCPVLEDVLPGGRFRGVTSGRNCRSDLLLATDLETRGASERAGMRRLGIIALLLVAPARPGSRRAPARHSQRGAVSSADMITPEDRSSRGGAIRISRTCSVTGVARSALGRFGISHGRVGQRRGATRSAASSRPCGIRQPGRRGGHRPREAWALGHEFRRAVPALGTSRPRSTSAIR